MCDKLFARNKFHILDGAMGSMLQSAGLKLGEIPDVLSVTEKEKITEIHRAYVRAGSEFVYTNTFGANALKLKKSQYTVEQVVENAIENARNAVKGTSCKVVLDVGPLGEMLEPAGTLSFDKAYDLFKQIIIAGKSADAVVFETFSDVYELKAAILAAKENSELPVMCSMSFEANGRTFTGVSVECFEELAVGLGVDAIGINCSLGPKEILPFAKKLCALTPENFLVFVKPNAGLPRPDGSGYDLTDKDFGEIIALYADTGIVAVGGCCGTTPDYIKCAVNALKDKIPADKPCFNSGYITSYSKAVEVNSITVIGERINPTGKKRFQQALRENDGDYVLAQALEQVNAGASVLDVNVGIPDIDETEVLPATVKNIQSVVDAPLQLDSSSPEALEKALRYYNGKPIVNSVNGEEKSLSSILPLCKKYGAAVVGLTLDENGIPETAEQRVEIAQRIVKRAMEEGIRKEDIYVDCLTMTISANQSNAAVTLSAMESVKKKLGVKTVLGVSNVSFGLPMRNYVNSTFLTLAMQKGLDLAIINPNSEEMMSSVYSFRALTMLDENCTDYLARYKNAVAVTNVVNNAQSSPAETPKTLKDCVIQGLKGQCAEITRELLKSREPLDIVDGELIPALDKIGMDYECGKAYLPELLQSATAAQSAFEVLKEFMAKSGIVQRDKGKIIVATVKGDVHDIGKNIVKVVLENYGYNVLDLGRDVDPQSILNHAKANGVKLIGLSALMTTTVKSMEETVKLFHKELPECKIMVGGAVLTEEYALKMGADYYSKDAKQSADIAKAFFAKN